MPLLPKRGASRAPILRAAKTHEAQKWPGEVLLHCLNMKELGFEVQKRQPKNTNEHAGDLLRKCMLHRSLSLTYPEQCFHTLWAGCPSWVRGCQYRHATNGIAACHRLTKVTHQKAMSDAASAATSASLLQLHLTADRCPSGPAQCLQVI